MNRVILQLGGNRGNVEKNFTEAIAILEAKAGMIVLKSSLYETEPWGFADKRWFLNQVVELQTYLSAMDLLKITQDIERELGRIVKKSEWLYEGRPIDIDILYFNDEIIHTNNLMIPHPHIRYRKFVLDPLCDYWGDYEHPEFGLTNEELRNSCDDCCVVRKHQLDKGTAVAQR
ncbi:MAG: 2-amino-4-hydroxy-6-hydroxymethyldihydropteridine diphosphokinase [Breznakibacter sp.]